MTTKTNTTAERIASALGDDGQCFETDAGTLSGLAHAAGGEVSHDQSGRTRWSLPDGSSIVESEAGWDLGFSDLLGCYCWPEVTPEHEDGCPAKGSRLMLRVDVTEDGWVGVVTGWPEDGPRHTVVSDGATRWEALQALAEALAFHLETLSDESPIPREVG